MIEWKARSQGVILLYNDCLAEQRRIIVFLPSLHDLYRNTYLLLTQTAYRSGRQCLVIFVTATLTSFRLEHLRSALWHPPALPRSIIYEFVSLRLC